MKVILKADVKGSGRQGELVNVSDGYARNYLLPRRLAVEADASALNQLHARQEAARHRQEVERQDAQEASRKLAGRIVRVTAKAGTAGRLFGKVTSREIAAALAEQFGIKIDKRKIVLDAAIKSFGTYPFEVKLYSGITAKLSVAVGEQG